MAARLVGRLPTLVGGGLAGAGASQFAPSEFGLLFRDCFATVRSALLTPSSELAAALAAQKATSDAQQRAFESMLAKLTEALLRQQQPRGLSLRALLLGGSLIAGAAAAVYGYGLWSSFGWVTPVQLQEGLETVREAVIKCYNDTCALLASKFGLLEKRITEVNAHVDEVSAELKAEVQIVGASVCAVEKRLEPIERDVHRTAEGVGLLCEVVAGLTSNATPDLIRRLDDFTGIETNVRAPARLEQSAPAAPPGFLRELLSAPVTGERMVRSC